VRLLAIATCAAITAIAPSAAAAPTRSLPVRLGVGIGPVNLGMTEAQVRRSLGRPGAVLERRRIRGQPYIELQWRFGDWNVGLVGRKGSRRVVLVGTGLARHRTPQRIGVGSTEGQLARRHRGLRERWCPNPHGLDRRQLILQHGETETVFVMVARDVHSGAYRPEVGSVEIRGGVTLRCGVP
jgi:hypothetical protein